MIQLPYWAAALLLLVAWSGGFIGGAVWASRVAGQVAGRIAKEILADPRWEGGGR